ncbi:MAG TPA: hypothetical protein VMS17_05040 [Gemmataceae bacterium]|nr:hypothetical protein [Gemmataceae bacterium]
MLTETRDQTEAAPLVNPIHFFVRVFLRLTLAFVVVPLPLFLVSRVAGFWAELFGCLFAVSMLIAAGITALYSWSISRRLKRFQKGDYLVHWTYTEEEWLSFAEMEWRRRRRETGRAPLVGLLIGGFSGLFCGGAAGYGLMENVPAVALGAVIGGAAFALLGGLLGWLGGAAARYAGWRTYQRMQKYVGETYIGADAAYCGETFWSWTMPNMALVRMELIPGDPAVLVFTLRVHMPKGGAALYSYRAPAPAGREEEARRILHWLGGK